MEQIIESYWTVFTIDKNNNEINCNVFDSQLVLAYNREDAINILAELYCTTEEQIVNYTNTHDAIQMVLHTRNMVYGFGLNDNNLQNEHYDDNTEEDNENIDTETEDNTEEDNNYSENNDSDEDTDTDTDTDY